MVMVCFSVIPDRDKDPCEGLFKTLTLPLSEIKYYLHFPSP